PIELLQADIEALAGESVKSPAPAGEFGMLCSSIDLDTDISPGSDSESQVEQHCLYETKYCALAPRAGYSYEWQQALVVGISLPLAHAGETKFETFVFFQDIWCEDQLRPSILLLIWSSKTGIAF